MDKETQSRAPLIVAIVLLLLPMLYVGSYLALVMPGPNYATTINGKPFYTGQYRIGDVWSERMFWPLEQIDRKLRRAAWERPPPRPDPLSTPRSQISN